MERRLTEDEAAAVFRRAAELDDSASSSSSSGTGLDRVAVERAALEVGLSRSAVHRALAELDAGRLRPDVSTRSQWRWREGVATVERFVDVSPSVAQAHLETYLKRQLFRASRRRGPISVWEPAEGLTATVVRGTDVSGRLRLKSVTAVTLCVMPTDAGGAHVRVDVDFTKARNANRFGAIAGAVTGGITAVAAVGGALLGAEPALLALPVAGGISVGGWFGARSSYAKVVDRAVTAVELALDELETL